MKALKWLLAAFLLLYGGLVLLVYSFQEKLLFHPYPLAKDAPLGIAVQHQEFAIPVEPNVFLNSALIPTKQHKGLILFFHGNTGNIVRASNKAGVFEKLGWDVMMVDYRSFGKSDGELEGETFLNDGLISYDYAHDSLGYDRIVVYGHSMGTGVAAYIASLREPTAVVLETPYYSMELIAEDQYPYLPLFILDYPLRSFEYLQNVTCPLLAFHGTRDEVIPYAEHAQRLANEIPHLELVTLEGAGHLNIMEQPKYGERLSIFLAEL